MLAGDAVVQNGNLGGVRLGLLGAGNIGREHIRNLALLTDLCTLVVVADDYEQSRSEARELLDGLGMQGCRVVSTCDEVLMSDEVDAVIIATPNFHHIDVLRAAASGGKALMIEKPLCTTIEDCKVAAKLAKLSNNIWWVGMEYRYIPSIQRLIREVTSGTIGTLKMLSIREHRFPFLNKVNQWNRFNSKTGGTLVEKCCHFFDLMLLIMESPPVRVFGSGSQDVNHLGEEYDGQKADILDNAYVVVDFENGARACLDLCMFAEASRNQEEIIAVGDGGKLEAFAPSHGTTSIDPGTPNFVIGKRSFDGTNGRDPPPPTQVEQMHISIDPTLMAAGHHCGATYTELKNFCETVSAGGTAAEVSVGDGLRAVALGVAAQMSIAEHRVVEIAELGLDEYFKELSILTIPASRQVSEGEPALPVSGMRKASSTPNVQSLDKDGFGIMFYPNRLPKESRPRSASPPKSQAATTVVH